MTMPLWLRLVWFAAALLVATLLAGWWWIDGDADWRRVEREAVAAGFSFDQADAVEAPMDAIDQARLRALAHIAAGISLTLYDRSAAGREKLHEALATGAAAVADIEYGIDGLPDRPLGAERGASAWRPLCEVLEGRLIDCDDAQVEACALRAIHAMSLGGDVFLARRMLDACCSRAAGLRGHERVAAAIERWSATFVPRLLRDQRRRLAADACALHHPSQQGIADLSGRYYRTFDLYAGVMVARATREARLRESLRAVAATRDHPDPETWPARFRAAAGAAVGSSRSPTGRTFLNTLRSTGFWELTWAKLLLESRVLVAELRGQPWPVDLFDPAGSPVRRVERDGRLIGAYSLGDDGIDGGGDRHKDACWRLYEELGSPRAGDALKPAAMTALKK